MKKFKILIDCPWGKAGEIFEGGQDQKIHYIQYKIPFCPLDYPQLFQEIEELSDEDWLAEWLCSKWNPNNEWCTDACHEKFNAQWIRLAKAVITNGFNVKKLREEK